MAGRRHSLRQWTRIALAPLGLRPAAHHIALLSALGDVAAGRCDRLMVLMPPGSAKSTYASVLFPPWWLSRHPRGSVIAASHTADLAAHFGRRVRNLIAEHVDLLGYGLAADSRAAARFATTAGGEYFASGLGGPLAGRRADLVLIDDPVKGHAEADSAAHRDFVWDWYRADLLSRVRPRGLVVLIMTRWHVDDLGGRLLATDERWRVLRMPALAEIGDPLGRVPGAPLWAGSEDLAALDRRRTEVGARVWAALYQQTPLRTEGALFPVTKLGMTEAAPASLLRVRGWDLAATIESAGRDPDYTVGALLGRDEAGRIFVLDIVRMRGGPHEVEQVIRRTAERDGVDVPITLPQDPGQAGKMQLAWLTRALAGFVVAGSPETGAKATRAAPFAAQIAAGNVSLLRGRWNADLVEELAAFPSGRHDDQVDALARAMGNLVERGPRPRRAAIDLFVR